MCVFLLSVLVVFNLCIFLLLCFSVVVQLFVVMSCWLAFVLCTSCTIVIIIIIIIMIRVMQDFSRSQ